MERSIVEYASSVWDPPSIAQIEAVNKRLLGSVETTFQGIPVFLTCCPHLIYHR